MNSSSVYSIPCASPSSSSAYTGDSHSSSSRHSVDKTCSSVSKTISLTLLTTLIIFCCVIATITVTQNVLYEKVTSKLSPHLTASNLSTSPSSLQLSASRPLVTYDDDNSSLDQPLINDPVTGEKNKHLHSTLVVRDYVKVTTNDALVSQHKHVTPISNPMYSHSSGSTLSSSSSYPNHKFDSFHQNRLQPIMSINGYYYGLYPVIQRSVLGTNEFTKQITSPLTLSSALNNRRVLHSPQSLQSSEWMTKNNGASRAIFPASSSSSSPTSFIQPSSSQVDSIASHPSTSLVNNAKGHLKLPIHRESHFHSPQIASATQHSSSSASVQSTVPFTYHPSRPFYPTIQVDTEERVNNSPVTNKFTLNSSNNQPHIGDTNNNSLAPRPPSYALTMPYFCRCEPATSSPNTLSSAIQSSSHLPVKLIHHYIPVLKPPRFNENPSLTKQQQSMHIQSGKIDNILLEKKETIHVSLDSIDDTNKSNSSDSSSSSSISTHATDSSSKKLISSSDNITSFNSPPPPPPQTYHTSALDNTDKIVNEITNNKYHTANEIMLVDNNEKSIKNNEKIDEQAKSIRSTSMKDDAQKVSLV